MCDSETCQPKMQPGRRDNHAPTASSLARTVRVVASDFTVEPPPRDAPWGHTFLIAYVRIFITYFTLVYYESVNCTLKIAISMEIPRTYIKTHARSDPARAPRISLQLCSQGRGSFLEHHRARMDNKDDILRILSCERNLLADGNVIEEEADLQDYGKSVDEMKEFMETYADLTAEQLEEVNSSFKQHGIHDFDALSHFSTEDLMNKFELSEETAKKVQLATMKNTCLVFAELAEMGGIPLMSSEAAGSAERSSTNQDADHMEENKQPTCLVT
jgi:hypothetical protein